MKKRCFLSVLSCLNYFGMIPWVLLRLVSQIFYMLSGMTRRQGGRSLTDILNDFKYLQGLYKSCKVQYIYNSIQY